MKNGEIAVEQGQCDFCGTCAAVCPANAIEIKESMIQIDRMRCTLCGWCTDICPLGVLEVRP